VKDGSAYHVGIRFLEYGTYARVQFAIYEITTPEVDELAASTGELANQMVEEHGRGTYLHRTRGDKAVQVEAYVGTRVPLHGTSLGKAILAHLPREWDNEIVTFNDEERIAGLRCVAAPILNKNDRVLGAISVAGPSYRIKDDRFSEELPQRGLETVNVIELDITYS
jgi:IclR family acetate operon transcriptional repressor